ncbi:hypothetical protein AMTR_s00093p00107560 [Amborella trichopoda]|uniref:Uncharacterized protein n=1 Tax=Amborella trichopoda TaxID=13333 RepID=W1NVW2_AMBTC|nr:hypothetical protein AMTR_s00093p00107560 [Amborella trichopoda]
MEAYLPLSSSVCITSRLYSSPSSKLVFCTHARRQARSPSVADVERAIGAGSFHDNKHNPRRGVATTTPAKLIEMVREPGVGREEGSTPRKLHEAGEWMLRDTEDSSRSGI